MNRVWPTDVSQLAELTGDEGIRTGDHQVEVSWSWPIDRGQSWYKVNDVWQNEGYSEINCERSIQKWIRCEIFIMNSGTWDSGCVTSLCYRIYLAAVSGANWLTTDSTDEYYRVELHVLFGRMTVLMNWLQIRHYSSVIKGNGQKIRQVSPWSEIPTLCSNHTCILKVCTSSPLGNNIVNSWLYLDGQSTTDHW